MPFVSPYDKPTRMEALRYYRRVSDTFKLDIALRRDRRRRDRDAGCPTLTGRSSSTPQSARGVRRSIARRGRSCSRPAPTTSRIASACPARICRTSRTTTREPHPFYRKQVVIVGGKNSAAEAALDLYRAGATSTIVHRGAALGDSIKYWVKPDIENRIKEGSIPRALRDARRRDSPDDRGRRARRRDRRDRGRRRVPADRLRRGHRRCSERPASRSTPRRAAPVFDAETFETNVPGLYTVGAMVAGMPERPDLHRERPLPRRAGDRSDSGQAGDVGGSGLLALGSGTIFEMVSKVFLEPRA